MDYRYSVPVEKEVEKCLKNDKQGKRAYEKRLQVFEKTPEETMKDLGEVKGPFSGSPNKLHQWKVDLPNNRTGRMMFVVFRGVAFFLHFFIKKSHKGNVTPPENMQVAEARASRFWAPNQK